MAVQMDEHRRVPLLGGRGDEHAVAHDPGVVDDDMEVTERGDRGFDDALRRIPVGDVLIIGDGVAARRLDLRSEEHTSELQSLMRISYAVFCLKKKKNNQLYKISRDQ